MLRKQFIHDYDGLAKIKPENSVFEVKERLLYEECWRIYHREVKVLLAFLMYYFGDLVEGPYEYNYALNGTIGLRKGSAHYIASNDLHHFYYEDIVQGGWRRLRGADLYRVFLMLNECGDLDFFENNLEVRMR